MGTCCEAFDSYSLSNNFLSHIYFPCWSLKALPSSGWGKVGKHTSLSHLIVLLCTSFSISMTPSPRGFQGLKTLGFVAKALLVFEVKVDSALLQGAPLSITLGCLVFTFNLCFHGEPETRWGSSWCCPPGSSGLSSYLPVAPGQLGFPRHAYTLSFRRGFSKTSLHFITFSLGLEEKELPKLLRSYATVFKSREVASESEL